MEQLLNNLQHPSLQDIGTIIGIAGATISAIAAIARLFLPANKDNNVHFIHHFPYQLENTNWSGFLALIFLCCSLVLFAFSIDPLINPFHPASPSDQAQIIIQQFYEDINNKDYQPAYSLLRDGWSEPYSKFVSGYKETEHVDITFEEIEEQPPFDTVVVDITINASEDHPDGKQIHTYSGFYIIGKENGTYKILDGNLTKIS
jgi:hypothetical protein